MKKALLLLNYGHVKKVFTNNRIQAGFNSARRKKAKSTKNKRMHNQRNTRLFGNVQNFLFHLKLTELSILPLTLVVLSPK